MGPSPWHGLWAFLLHSLIHLQKNPLHRAVERTWGLAWLPVNLKAHGWFIHQQFLLKYLLDDHSAFLDTGLECDPAAGVPIPHPIAHLTEAGVWFRSSPISVVHDNESPPNSSQDLDTPSTTSLGEKQMSDTCPEFSSTQLSWLAALPR